jgi:hypothetical protein
LIITRPQLEIDYPLWNEARQVWAQNQPSVQDITKDLQQAGFSNVSHTLEPYPCSVSLERWQGMVQKRFWSTFSKFSNQGEIFLETVPICRGNPWWLSQTFRNTSNVALLFHLFCHFKSWRKRAKLLPRTTKIEPMTLGRSILKIACWSSLLLKSKNYDSLDFEFRKMVHQR